MAEGKGFEPPKGISSFNDLANRRSGAARPRLGQGKVGSGAQRTQARCQNV